MTTSEPTEKKPTRWDVARRYTLLIFGGILITAGVWGIATDGLAHAGPIIALFCGFLAITMTLSGRFG